MINKKEIDKWLAIEVMGWIKNPLYEEWMDADCNYTYAWFEWHPTTDRNQAIDCLETWQEQHMDKEIIREYSIQRVLHLLELSFFYIVVLTEYNKDTAAKEIINETISDTMGLAICRAIYESRSE